MTAPLAEARAGAAISISDVGVTFGAGPEAVAALDGITLHIPDGAFVSLVGPSGCGKSTLLNVVADLLAPSRGRVTIGGAAGGSVAGAVNACFP